MFERDYLMRIIAELGAAIRRSIDRAQSDRDPSDAATMLDAAIGAATDLDGAALLSLSPDSIASVLQVSGTDPAVTEHLCRSLLLAGRYYAESGNAALASLREGQARAVAEAYGHNLDESMGDPDAVLAFLDEGDNG